MNKYQVEVYSGCMGTYITVNDESIYDLDDDVLLDFKSALCAKLLKGLTDQSIDLHDLLQILQCSKQEYDKDDCGQCGHNGLTQTWEI
jgi:hypothetical protein